MLDARKAQTASRDEVEARTEARNPCFRCGREVSDEPGGWVHLSTDFTLVAKGEETESSQGWFPVGSTCATKIPSAYVSQA